MVSIINQKVYVYIEQGHFTNDTPYLRGNFNYRPSNGSFIVSKSCILLLLVVECIFLGKGENLYWRFSFMHRINVQQAKGKLRNNIVIVSTYHVYWFIYITLHSNIFHSFKFGVTVVLMLKKHHDNKHEMCPLRIVMSYQMLSINEYQKLYFMLYQCQKTKQIPLNTDP